jgi:hypothetical protein
MAPPDFVAFNAPFNIHPFAGIPNRLRFFSDGLSDFSRRHFFAGVRLEHAIYLNLRHRRTPYDSTLREFDSLVLGLVAAVVFRCKTGIGLAVRLPPGPFYYGVIRQVSRTCDMALRGTRFIP